MPLSNTPYVYGSIAKAFHWTMFVLIAGMLAVGFIMTDMPLSPDKFRIYGLHKSIGIIVLILAGIRLMWKCVNTAPLLPASMKKLEKLAAQSGHAFLYFLMFAMPLSGWAMSSASGFPVSFFGLFLLPDLVTANHDVKEFFEEVHEWLALVLIAMVALHIGAALLHHFYHRNNVLRKMLPFTKEEKYAQDSDTATGC